MGRPARRPRGATHQSTEVAPDASSWLSVESAPKATGVAEQMWWTLCTIVVYMISCQVPLYGIMEHATADPFAWMRIMAASNRGTLMELGISPIITAGMVMQFARALDLTPAFIQRHPSALVQRYLALAITATQAVGYVVMGMYGPMATLGPLNGSLIVAQLLLGGYIIVLLDDLLQKGWGIGSGVSLFVAIRACESVFDHAISMQTTTGDRGTEYRGALVALVHLLWVRNDKIMAVVEAATRANLPNLAGLVATAAVAVLGLYLQACRLDVAVQRAQLRGVVGRFGIRLLYTNNMPIILQTALLTNLYALSQLVYFQLPPWRAVAWLGEWQERGGAFVPTSGLVYYLTAPPGLLAAPLHSLVFFATGVAMCGLLARTWLDISGTSVRDVSTNLERQRILTAGGAKVAIRRYIPVATVLGGAAIGMLSMGSDMMGTVGSGTAVLLAVTTICDYVEAFGPEIASMFR